MTMQRRERQLLLLQRNMRNQRQCGNAPKLQYPPAAPCRLSQLPAAHTTWRNQHGPPRPAAPSNYSPASMRDGPKIFRRSPTHRVSLPAQQHRGNAHRQPQAASLQGKESRTDPSETAAHCSARTTTPTRFRIFIGRSCNGHHWDTRSCAHSDRDESPQLPASSAALFAVAQARSKPYVPD
jgi:hypothetical protein